MVLTRRLKNLERSHVAACLICGGRGRWMAVYENQPECLKPLGSPSQDQAGCPGCGLRQILTVRYVDEAPNQMWT